MSALPEVGFDVPMAGRRAPAIPVADVPLAQSLAWLDFVVGWPGGWLNLRTDGPERSSIWIRTPVGLRGRSELAHYTALLEELNTDVECSMLRPKRGWGTSAVPALHVRVEGKKQADRLRNFRPVPTFVIREGSTTRYVALWMLRAPLRKWSDSTRANKRIAHALGASKKNCFAGDFSFPVPGSVLRAGRKRPVPVVVARAGLEAYTVREVVGRLRDAPDPESWRDAPGNTKGRRY